MTTAAPFFIVNPASGGGRTRRKLDRLREAIQRNAFEPEIALTEYPWHGYDIARRAIADGRDLLVACGGDGTVYEVANAILDAGVQDDVRLATVPLGTGKDVAKCLAVGRPAAALRLLATAPERRIDAGRVECHDDDGNPRTRHFLLEAAAGWIPEISHSVPRRLKLLGDTAPYVIMTLVKMAGPMNREFEVEIDQHTYNDRYNSVTVHNMEFWGGDLHVMPGACPDDGLLDVIRWGAVGRRKVLAAIRGQQNGGTHLALEGVNHQPMQQIRLAAPKRTKIDLDGEMGGYLPATISVLPRAIRFLAPAAPAADPLSITG